MHSKYSTEPTVSFVVPALNAEATLGACLDAILAARNAAMRKEVLLIDNGSTDRTVEIALDRGVTVVSAPGVTVAALRNLGATVAEGEIVAFVDADCVIAPDWLEKALVHFRDPAVGAVGSPTHAPSGATWVQRTWALHRHRRNRRGHVEWLPTENLLIRKTTCREIGGFNEALVTCEDVDLCYRLAATHKILNDPDVRSIHLGEAPTLTAFFRKESWRGTGNIAGFRSHRFRPQELPSVLLPVYHAACAVSLVGTLGYWLATGRALLVAAVALLLVGPSLLFALGTAVRAGQIRFLPSLIIIYGTYAAARSVAIIPSIPFTRRSANQRA